MARDRVLQTTFNNLVGSARFKALQGKTLMKVRRPRTHCGAAESRSHLKICYRVPGTEGMSPEEKIGLVVTVCREARVDGPNYPLASD